MSEDLPVQRFESFLMLSPCTSLPGYRHVLFPAPISMRLDECDIPARVEENKSSATVLRSRNLICRLDHQEALTMFALFASVDAMESALPGPIRLPSARRRHELVEQHYYQQQEGRQGAFQYTSDLSGRLDDRRGINFNALS